MSTEEVLKKLLVMIRAIDKSLDLWQALTCGGTYAGGFSSLSDLYKIKEKLGVSDFRGYVKTLHGHITLDDDFMVSFALALDEMESRSKLQTFLEKEWKNAGESIFEYGFDGEKLDDFRRTGETDVLKDLNGDLLGLFIELDKTLCFLSLSDTLHAIIPYRYKSIEENWDDLIKLVKKPTFKRQMEKVRAFVNMEMQRQETEMKRWKERAGGQSQNHGQEDGASLQTDGEASTGEDGGGQSEKNAAVPGLVTKREKKYFAKAIEAGYLEENGNGGYTWLYHGVRWASLAYFLYMVSGGDCTAVIPYTRYEALFNHKRLDSDLTQALKAKKEQKWRANINKLFEE